MVENNTQKDIDEIIRLLNLNDFDFAQQSTPMINNIISSPKLTESLDSKWKSIGIFIQEINQKANLFDKNNFHSYFLDCQKSYARIMIKAYLVKRILEELDSKSAHTQIDGYLYVNCFRTMFEIVYRFLLPYFKKILKIDGFLKWFLIEQRIQRDWKVQAPFFISMRRQVRNAIAHESYLLIDDYMEYDINDVTHKIKLIDLGKDTIALFHLINALSIYNLQYLIENNIY
ncbi:hypothetical protein K9M79_01450 [Candidatus Woesearchaeota archaeon]|nr:hypothetical protein [Candidatus Woesearchaeota archaeon]